MSYAWAHYAEGKDGTCLYLYPTREDSRKAKEDWSHNPSVVTLTLVHTWHEESTPGFDGQCFKLDSYFGVEWCGVDLRINTKTMCSKELGLSAQGLLTILGPIGNIMFEARAGDRLYLDNYDYKIYVSSENYKQSGYGRDLDLLVILH